MTVGMVSLLNTLFTSGCLVNTALPPVEIVYSPPKKVCKEAVEEFTAGLKFLDELGGSFLPKDKK